MLDEKEEKAFKVLNEKYEKFMKKSLISQGAEKIKDKSKEIIPQKAQDYIGEKIKCLSEKEIWKNVMKMAGDGFVVLQGVAAKYTINKEKIIKEMNKIDKSINSLDDIYLMKSYEIEDILNSRDWQIYLQTIAEAAPTGLGGVSLIALNLLLATFIQFRTVQLTAMYYGYNVKSNQTEMDFASSVYLQIISKGQISEVDGFGEIIGKMMTQAELISLRKALTTKTYEQMAQLGGIELLYVQIRAITNKVANKALNGIGEKEFENQALKKILEALSEKMTKDVGAKSIPVISSILNILIDTHLISKIIRMSSIIYQKRFLIDKEMRDYPNKIA